MYSFYNKEENKNLKVLEGSFVCLQTKLIFKWDKKNFQGRELHLLTEHALWSARPRPLLGVAGEACLSTL